MAEGVGVSSTPKTPTAKAPADAKKKRRLLIFGGLAAGGFLLISSKGNAANSAGGTDQQAQSDALAAEEAAMLNPPVPGGGAPVDTGGGSYTTQGPEATTAPAVTVNQPPATINVNVPGGGKKKKGHKDAGTSAKKHRNKPKGNVKSKQGSHGKPPPAKSKGKGAGKHPSTNHKTSHGHHKHSPAVVESEFGVGSGQVVMGRRFPGAIAHRLGAPRRQTDGTVARAVTVDYGGHTETHLVHNNGERWTDRAPGRNPPSRGVPVNTGKVPV